MRETTPPDREQVLDIVRLAFSSDGRDGSEETGIVERTWALRDEVGTIDLVAADDDSIVGHVMAAEGWAGDRALLALAPLCVAPPLQRSGVGSALVGDLLARASGERWPAVVLLGDPRYYGRFGFESTAPYGIVYPPVRSAPEYFQIRWLGDVDPSISGDFRYCWED